MKIEPIAMDCLRWRVGGVHIDCLIIKQLTTNDLSESLNIWNIVWLFMEYAREDYIMAFRGKSLFIIGINIFILFVSLSTLHTAHSTAFFETISIVLEFI